MPKSRRFYTYDSPHGKLWAYRREYKGQQLRKKGFTTKSAAENHLKQVMDDIDALERGEVRCKPSTILDAYNLYKEQQDAIAARKNYRYQMSEASVFKLLKDEFVDVVGEQTLCRHISMHHINQFMHRISFKHEKGKIVLDENEQPVVRMSKATVMARTSRLYGMLRLAQRTLPDLAQWQVPYLKLRRCRADNIKVITPEERVTLFNALSHPPLCERGGVNGFHYQLRQKMCRELNDLCRILYATGMRLNEALSLKWSQINFDSGTVHIFASKTETERDVPMSDEMIALLNQRIIDGVVDDELVFKRNRNKDFSTELGTYMRRVAELNGIPYGRKNNGFTFHSFRHTFICDMLQLLNGDAKAVMELSGHTNYEGFQVYLHAARDSHEKARELIKKRNGNDDGFLTGLGVNEVKEVAEGVVTTPSKPHKKRRKTPAYRVSLEKR